MRRDGRKWGAAEHSAKTVVGWADDWTGGGGSGRGGRWEWMWMSRFFFGRVEIIVEWGGAAAERSDGDDEIDYGGMEEAGGWR